MFWRGIRDVRCGGTVHRPWVFLYGDNNVDRRIKRSGGYVRLKKRKRVPQRKKIPRHPKLNLGG